MPQSSYTVFGTVVPKTVSCLSLVTYSDRATSITEARIILVVIWPQFTDNFYLFCYVSVESCVWGPLDQWIIYFFFSGSVCYCLALKSKKWSIIYFKSDVKLFPWHIIRLNFITWFVCVFFVCFHVQINLKTVCILHKTMMTDSPIMKSIGTWVFLPLFITCVAKRFCFCIWARGSQAG